MSRTNGTSEPFYVGARFRITVEAAIVQLQAAAARDERLLALLEDPDHRRRQRRLVESQLERAFQLQELLARTCVRPERAA